mmetsp:Transcript_27254/g.34055  ORF Transcript_27254/g.34055 Transcript_27254/m.34055 type:complete len:460 (+) Transcript_27254:117-1496(+)
MMETAYHFRELFSLWEIFPCLNHILFSLALFWSFVEICFYMRLNFHMLPKINKLTDPAKYPRNPEFLMKSVVEKLEGLVHEGHYCYKRFFSWWHRGAPFEKIRYGNLFEWLAWSMFTIHTEDLTRTQAESVKNTIKLIEQKLEYKFPKGFDREVKAVRFTLEPIATFYRPFIVYFILLLVKKLGDLLLRLKGFRWYTTAGIGYWYRPKLKHQRIENLEDPLPMVFYHGLGTGIVLCLRLIFRLSYGRPAFLIELNHVAPSLQFENLGYQELPKKTQQILQRHGAKKCCVVGHSFGTVCAGWLIKYLPNVVGQAVFLDPVCFLLWLPDIAYNFLYKEPTNFVEWILSRGISLEPTISNSLRRHFWWYQNILHYEDLHCPAVVSLGAKDEVFAADSVKGYFGMHLRKEDVKESDNLILHWEPHHTHGRILISKRAQKNLLSSINLQQKKKSLTGQEQAITH